jgi:hypothetical protein
MTEDRKIHPKMPPTKTQKQDAESTPPEIPAELASTKTLSFDQWRSDDEAGTRCSVSFFIVNTPVPESGIQIEVSGGM